MTIKNKNIAIVILAAGASSRMGKTKQLLPWKNTNLLTNAIDAATSSDAKKTVVVLGADREKILKENLFTVEHVFNPLWSKGMGGSIATGVDYLLSKDDYDAILIMLADQPLVDSSYINHFLNQFLEDPNTIIASDYGQHLGVPALFGKSYFLQLTKLNSNIGARTIIELNLKHVNAVDIKNKGRDIDTENDYNQLKSTLK